MCFNSIMEADAFAGVELRHLRALLAVRDARSFSRAAASLGYAQSAVSQQIAALERAVGARLVERPGGPRPVSLTEAGRVLARHAEQVVERMAAARGDLHALAAGEAGTVRIGIFQSAGAQLLPRVLARYRQSWPDVEIELVERLNDRELLDLVAAGELDVTFAVHDEDDPRLAHRVLVEDPYVVLAPPGTPIARAARARLEDFEGLDLIAPNVCSCYDRLEAEWSRRGVTPNLVFRTDDNLTTQRLVGAGLGCSVMPRLALEQGPHAGPAVVVPIDESLPPRRIALYGAADRYRSPAVRAFIETATDEFAPEAVAA
jgi:DNA-binding transcriptional LysR family regulator